MTAVTIANSIGQTFEFQDGDVSLVSSRITSTPDADPMPGSPPGESIIFDLNGSLKLITVSGELKVAATNRVTGTSPPSATTTIAQQKRWLESLHTGMQRSVLFTSNYEQYTFIGTLNSGQVQDFITGSSEFNTYAVILDISFTENAGDPNRLPFTMRLAVGQTS